MTQGKNGEIKNKEARPKRALLGCRAEQEEERRNRGSQEQHCRDGPQKCDCRAGTGILANIKVMIEGEEEVKEK